MPFKVSNYVNAIVVIAALGYFVDIYDLILFSIVRMPSLRSIGLSGDLLFKNGVFLLNMQMAGMLLGGLLWGIVGDKKGRVSVLFGSILLYSSANIANGFVHSVTTYGILRFIAGIGLAGELGAGITLVAESLPKHTRGVGTAIVGGIGIAGAVFAGLAAEYFGWRTAYFLGGGLGMALLLLRVGAFESGLFETVAKDSTVERGSLRLLFSSKERIVRYVRSILIGLPTWYVIGILATFSPEIAAAVGVPGAIVGGRVIMIVYSGIVVGDLVCGALSQWWKSRKKVVRFFLFLTVVSVAGYLYFPFVSPRQFYLASFFIGLSVGYWALFVTIAAEQFGTNLRATVATTVPNFIRGSVIPMTLGFGAMKDRIGITHSTIVVGAICFAIAFSSLHFMKDTFHTDLDYIET